MGNYLLNTKFKKWRWRNIGKSTELFQLANLFQNLVMC